MSKLNALQIRNKKESGLLSDGYGLFLEITETGIQRWIYCYKILGRTRLVWAGMFGYRDPTDYFTENDFILHGIQIYPDSLYYPFEGEKT